VFTEEEDESSQSLSDESEEHHIVQTYPAHQDMEDQYESDDSIHIPEQQRYIMPNKETSLNEMLFEEPRQPM